MNQKHISNIEPCNSVGISVIIKTDLLESMFAKKRERERERQKLNYMIFTWTKGINFYHPGILNLRATKKNAMHYQMGFNKMF